jgi:hypothetical protein
LPAEPWNYRWTGLTNAEGVQIEAEFAIAFPLDLRLLLAAGLPTGSDFPDWRTGGRRKLRKKLDWPIEGVLFDIREHEFWYREWPERATLGERLSFADWALGALPALIPIYSHRYIPSIPLEAGNPVFSVHQTDVIYYGADLEDYFENEFFDKGNEFHRNHDIVTKPTRYIPFWSDLAGPNWGDSVGD